MFKIQQKQRFIPLILIAILLLAYCFRWHIEVSKTYDNSVVKYARDRWTNDVWLKFYTLPDYIEVPASESKAKRNFIVKKHNIATGVWCGLLAINTIWLFFIIKKTKKVPALPKKEYQEKAVAPDFSPHLEPEINFVLIDEPQKAKIDNHKKEQKPKYSMLSVFFEMLPILFIVFLLTYWAYTCWQ